jgi:hypothetical protein
MSRKTKFLDENNIRILIDEDDDELELEVDLEEEEEEDPSLFQTEEVQEVQVYVGQEEVKYLHFPL